MGFLEVPGKKSTSESLLRYSIGEQRQVEMGKWPRRGMGMKGFQWASAGRTFNGGVTSPGRDSER